MKVLVLGVTGMLGNAVFKVFSNDLIFDVWGTLRNPLGLKNFTKNNQAKILAGTDVLDQDVLMRVMAEVKPQVVINCIGLIKQLADAKDPLLALPINSMLPHRLVLICRLVGARLIHVSTDCVFSGKKGYYCETDVSDADDLYGKSKFIGELNSQSNAITLRTSIIGHELGSNHALVDWFLSQSGRVKGYSNAIFSGVPTVELARVMKDYVVPNLNLNGLYHVAAKPISKYELLSLIAIQYGKKIEIFQDGELKIDRSLNGDNFCTKTGYVAPSWPELIKKMHARTY